MIHYTDKYLLNPLYKVTVNLVGCGGTGSQVLSMLAKMNVGLQSLGHPGLSVTVYDGDTVSEANQGRQLFSESDIGANKAVISVSRVNRFFGLDWEAEPIMFDAAKYAKANILITCVDSANARILISKSFPAYGEKETRRNEPNFHQKYWLDFGNQKKTAQVIIGSAGYIEQPESNEAISRLQNVVQYFPQLKKIKEKDQGPSCSIAQALNKQDLFINSTIANHGMSLLWTMFTEGRILHQGCYLNLNTSNVNPLPFK